MHMCGVASCTVIYQCLCVKSNLYTQIHMLTIMMIVIEETEMRDYGNATNCAISKRYYGIQSLLGILVSFCEFFVYFS